MRVFRFIGYFTQLRTIVGIRAAGAFALKHLWNKIRPPKGGVLSSVPVGPYVFYFPSLPYFEGLFTEIFFKETYYLTPTTRAIQAIDCGANIGVSLLYIKIRAPGAHVLCFEPNPAARAVLEKNIEANGWGKDVRVSPYALGKEDGETDFFVDEDMPSSSAGSVVQYQKNKYRKLNSYRVKIVRLSPYIQGSVDFLKMDVEGLEFEVLEELARERKLSSIAALQLEFHYIPGLVTRKLSEMLALLESEKFHAFAKSSAKPSDIVGHDTLHTYMIFAWR